MQAARFLASESEFASSTIPPVISWDGVGVLLEADGNVMARRYVAVALGHWGLFQTLARIFHHVFRVGGCFFALAAAPDAFIGR